VKKICSYVVDIHRRGKLNANKLLTLYAYCTLFLVMAMFIDGATGRDGLLMQTSTVVSMRSAFFWDFKHRRVVVHYRRFGTTYLPILQGSLRSKKTT